MTENQESSGERKLSYREQQYAARQKSVKSTGKKVQLAIGGALALAVILAGLDYVRKKRAAAAPPPDEDRPAFMFDENVEALQADAGSPKSDIALDLGKGVKMQFLWIKQLGAWVGRQEVSNREYRRFEPEHSAGKLGEHSLDGDQQPVVMVSHHQVAAFVKWVNAACAKQIPEMYRVRLPDGHEAATMLKCGDQREYPWGSEWPPPDDWNYHGEEGGGTAKKIEGHSDSWPVTGPVDQCGRNEWGLYGVGDNATEWTEKLVDRGSEGTGSYQLMGGSWHSGEKEQLRCDYAGRLYSKYATEFIGFRLVIAP